MKVTLICAVLAGAVLAEAADDRRTPSRTRPSSGLLKNFQRSRGASSSDSRSANARGSRRRDGDGSRGLHDPNPPSGRAPPIRFRLPPAGVQATPTQGAPQNSLRVQQLLSQIMIKAARKQNEPMSDDEILFNVVSDSIRSAAPEGEVEDDGTEVSRNFAILPTTFESDITLTEDQAIAILNGDEGRTRFKRKLVGDSRYRWGKTIGYAFSGGDGSWQAKIASGLREWSENTCLAFTRSVGRDHLNFVYGQGCYSNVGRIGGTQTVSIGRGCDIKGIVAHEVGHALGFWHEQSRPDRDNYISILAGNILRGTAGNFEKRTTRDTIDLGNPYDYGSVMHYGAKAFVKQYSLTSIQTKDDMFQQTIGQRNGLSFIDIKIINDAYCSDVCAGSRLSCLNDGYPDPKNCGRCRCPTGLSGNCNEVAPSSGSNCGGTLTASSSSWKALSSSASGAECHWLIRSDNGGRIYIELQDATYQKRYPDACSSFVELKLKKSYDQTGARFCSGTPSSGSWSDGSMVVVTHDTRLTGGSFRLRYRGDGTSGTPAPRRKPAPRPSPATPSPRTATWSAWSSCSQSCGGCGTKTRTARTSSATSRQRASCGTRACPASTTTSKCTIALSVPCWVIVDRSGSFNPRSADFTVQGLPSNFPDTDVELVKRSGRGRQVHEIDRRRKRQAGRRGPPRNNRGQRNGRRPNPQQQRRPSPKRQPPPSRRNGSRAARGDSGESRRRHPPGATTFQQQQMCKRSFTYTCSKASSGSCCRDYSNINGICIRV